MEELAHPFTWLARWLCETDAELGRNGGLGRVRRALLALSMQHKALKGMDGAAHSIGNIGASAASGSSVAECVATARDIVPSRRGALRARATAACRARAVQLGFEAAEACRTAFPGGRRLGFGEFFVDCRVIEQPIYDRTLVVLRWAGDAEALMRAVEAPTLRISEHLAANTILWRIAELIATDLPNGHSYVCVGHGVAGSIAALVTLLKKGDAIALGPAPCVTGACRCTSLVLGDDLVPRASRASLRRLRRRLRRFLPTSTASVGPGSLLRFGTAVATSVLEHSLASAVPKRSGLPQPHHDDLHIPGNVFYLKPRSDGSISLNKLGANKRREQLLWQLNDILLSKSMLAHHTLDAYIHSLERT